MQFLSKKIFGTNNALKKHFIVDIYYKKADNCIPYRLSAFYIPLYEPLSILFLYSFLIIQLRQKGRNSSFFHFAIFFTNTGSISSHDAAVLPYSSNHSKYSTRLTKSFPSHVIFTYTPCFSRPLDSSLVIRYFFVKCIIISPAPDYLCPVSL